MSTNDFKNCNVSNKTFSFLKNLPNHSFFFKGGHSISDSHRGPSHGHEELDHAGHGDDGHHSGIHLASWRWTEFSSAIMFTGLIISAVMLKIIFHHLPLLAKILPESCVLIVVGIFAGVLIHYVILDDILNIEDKTQHPFPQFTAPLFFEFLLPPIILDAALALYDDAFFDNFVSIMIFAIFGTLFNTFAIGYSIYGLSTVGALGGFQVLISNYHYH